MLEAGEREALSALPAKELWRLERKRDVDLDQVYGPGTMELRGELRALVLLRWRVDGRAFQSRRLDTAEALAALPLFYKDLGVFGLDGSVRAEGVVDRLSAYAELLDRLTVVEVRGGWDFAALRDLVGDLLGR
jgi:HprK-related kinase B